MAAENVERFATGAVRGTDVKARYDLIPLVGLRRLAETCAEGARKYGENNWARGIPSSNVINHALAHIANYLDGDRTEDHLAHASWNLFVAMHNEERRPDVHFPPPPATPEEIGEILKEYRKFRASDAEVNGLPSNLGRGIKNPTAGGMSPLDASVAVLSEVSSGLRDPFSLRDAVLEVFHEIQDSRRLPDGTQVESVNLSGFGDSGCVIEFLLEGRKLRARVVCNFNDPDDRGIACEDYTGDGPLWSIIAESVSRMLSRAVASRLHASSPSGPNSAGLQQPSTPSEPADQDFDEWMALRVRVDAANICPWVDHRTQQWCARDPSDGTVHFFGPSESDRDSAYRWADNILSRSHHEPHRETRP